MATTANVRMPKAAHQAAFSPDMARGAACVDSGAVVGVGVIESFMRLPFRVGSVCAVDPRAQRHWLNIATAISAMGARATQRMVISFFMTPPFLRGSEYSLTLVDMRKDPPRGR
jgi:hypothetical protein